MEKQLKKLIKKVNAAQDKARALLKVKAGKVGAGIKRANAFLERARGEIEDFRRQYLSASKVKRRAKSKRK